MVPYGETQRGTVASAQTANFSNPNSVILTLEKGCFCRPSKAPVCLLG